jgi:hypothetical protein
MACEEIVTSLVRVVVRVDIEPTNSCPFRDPEGMYQRAQEAAFAAHRASPAGDTDPKPTKSRWQALRALTKGDTIVDKRTVTYTITIPDPGIAVHRDDLRALLDERDALAKRLGEP